MSLLSQLNIWATWKDRHAQQRREVKENTSQPNRIIRMWEHRCWGDSIRWIDADSRRLTGWLTPLPKVNDELHCDMRSGKTGRFRITKVKYCTDPSDMFFADAEWMGYLEETDDPMGR